MQIDLVSGTVVASVTMKIIRGWGSPVKAGVNVLTMSPLATVVDQVESQCLVYNSKLIVPNFPAVRDLVNRDRAEDLQKESRRQAIQPSSFRGELGNSYLQPKILGAYSSDGSTKMAGNLGPSSCRPSTCRAPTGSMTLLKLSRKEAAAEGW